MGRGPQIGETARLSSTGRGTVSGMPKIHVRALSTSSGALATTQTALRPKSRYATASSHLPSQIEATCSHGNRGEGGGAAPHGQNQFLAGVPFRWFWF